MPGFSDSESHVEPPVSVRPCLKTRERNNSLNVCPVVEDEMDDDVMDDKEEPSEENRPVKGRQCRVMMPILKERQEHERTHLPYRSWSKQVSYGRRFMRDQPGMESAKILVSRDRATRMVYAHVVPLKGAVLDWVIQQCARDLERLGHYGQVTWKSDQEAAIVGVLREIANLRGSRGTLLEHSPIADSKSNGLLSVESDQLRRRPECFFLISEVVDC